MYAPRASSIYSVHRQTLRAAHSIYDLVRSSRCDSARAANFLVVLYCAGSTSTNVWSHTVSPYNYATVRTYIVPYCSEVRYLL